jgi:hypothetical protein
MIRFSPPVKRKNSEGTLRIDINWKNKWLDSYNYTLSSVSYDVPSGLISEKQSINISTGKSTIWLSGGDDGTTYRLVAKAFVVEESLEEKIISVDVEVTDDV